MRRPCTRRRNLPWEDSADYYHPNVETVRHQGEVVYHCKDCGEFSDPMDVMLDDLEAFEAKEASDDS